MPALRDASAPVEANGGDVVSPEHSFAGHTSHHSRPCRPGSDATLGLECKCENCAASRSVGQNACADAWHNYMARSHSATQNRVTCAANRYSH